MKVPKKADVGEVDDVEVKLQAYGEAFMRMFDDYDSEEERRSKRRKMASQAAALEGPSSSEHDDTGDPDDASDSDSSDSDTDPAAHSKDAPSGPSTSKQPVKEVVFLDKLWKRRPGAGGMDEAAQRLKAEQDALEQLKRRREQRKFMSAKVSLVHEELDQQRLMELHRRQQQQQVRADISLQPTAEEFARMQREVEEVGAAQLDKKALKQWKVRQLQAMGARARKAPRTPAMIGVGVAKHRQKVAQRQEQEAIASGMLKAKGLGKKKRKERSRAEKKDFGLQEAGSSFKNGVLFVKKNGKK